jgi:hypothetical protein
MGSNTITNYHALLARMIGLAISNLTVAISNRESELSCDFLGGKNIRYNAAPEFDIIICSLPIEIFTAGCMQLREGNVGLARAMPTMKIIDRTDDLHVGRRVGVDDARVHLPA